MPAPTSTPATPAAVVAPADLRTALTEALAPGRGEGPVWVVSTLDRAKGVLTPVCAFRDRAAGERYAEGLDVPAEVRQVEIRP